MKKPYIKPTIRAITNNTTDPEEQALLRYVKALQDEEKESQASVSSDK